LESLAAIAGGRGAYHAETEGILRQVCKIPMIKFLISADVNVGTCVSFVIYLPPLGVLQKINKRVQRLECNGEGSFMEKAGRNEETTEAQVG